MATNHEYNDRLRRESLKRAERIKKLRDLGLTWAQVGDKLKISRQRAQQLGAKLP